MSSFQKQIPSEQSESNQNFLDSFEKTILMMDDISEVELLMKKLQFLGLNYDPFNQDISVECSQVVENLGLSDHLKNPYLATNILLRLLDKTEEKLNKLKQ